MSEGFWKVVKNRGLAIQRCPLHILDSHLPVGQRLGSCGGYQAGAEPLYKTPNVDLEWNKMDERPVLGVTLKSRLFRNRCHWNGTISAYDAVPARHRETGFNAKAAKKWKDGYESARGSRQRRIDELQQAGMITAEQAQAQKERLQNKD